MQPYNVEIFDRSFNLVQHYNIESIDYAYDYLNPVENSIIIAFNNNVQKGDYIWIKNDVNAYFGYITGIDANSSVQGFSEIKFRQFLTIFDAMILFDTTLQGGSQSLEQTIANIITAYFIHNSDYYQNVVGLDPYALPSMFIMACFLPFVSFVRAGSIISKWILSFSYSLKTDRQNDMSS